MKKRLLAVVSVFVLSMTVIFSTAGFAFAHEDMSNVKSPQPRIGVSTGYYYSKKNVKTSYTWSSKKRVSANWEKRW